MLSKLRDSLSVSPRGSADTPGSGNTPRGSADATRGSTGAPRPAAESKVAPGEPLPRGSADLILKEITDWVGSATGPEYERRRSVREAAKQALHEGKREVTLAAGFGDMVLPGMHDERTKIRELNFIFRIAPPTESLPIPQPQVRMPAAIVQNDKVAIERKIAAIGALNDRASIEEACKKILISAKQIANPQDKLELFWQLATRINEASIRIAASDKPLWFAGKIFSEQLVAAANDLDQQMAAPKKSPADDLLGRLFNLMDEPVKQFLRM